MLTGRQESEQIKRNMERKKKEWISREGVRKE